MGISLLANMSNDIVTDIIEPEKLAENILPFNPPISASNYLTFSHSVGIGSCQKCKYVQWLLIFLDCTG